MKKLTKALSLLLLAVILVATLTTGKKLLATIDPPIGSPVLASIDPPIGLPIK